MTRSAADWLRAATARLAPLIGLSEAQRDARLILRAATDWSAARLVAEGATPLDAGPELRADAMLARRAGHEPLAQILGHWPFYGRAFAVDRNVLTPRADTETLIELALSDPFKTMIDLGTGSGAIAVTLLAERPTARGVATDLSPAALSIAARNATAHGVASRLDLAAADWWAGIGGRFDLIVSNPPYVTAADYAALAPEVQQYEPMAALTPGGDGLSAYRAILDGVAAHANPGARLLLEIGALQGQALRDMLTQAGFQDVSIQTDINGKDRVAMGRVGTAQADRCR
ncbi:Protein-N-glutamine methyltransferase PrmC, methylates polypeptide chain release factors RF1 and RF2 [Roseibacterium elongatum DSM 19469]|uniref:Release factor glutamine methyltransferase n=1 Tax=Roseicyclus elongatus DSM 19469 TaxID=1294273 RepID=W8RWC4_9RHOB|nr:peptide chain release factor N(5)-glutamine methyltransferase [Roseibacterium elongatum]AHM05474.1 Protein-N-glutamine methyltransferase PrmC, methylates polypeptide chain release factors RF1 and RF2 [Roseibacterium elongatum DSM 19469]